MCKIGSFKEREAEQKLNSYPVKAGFQIQSTALFKLLTVQAIFERKYKGKRPNDPGVEEVSASEPEGTPNKLSKSDSTISVFSITEKDSDEDYEESN